MCSSSQAGVEVLINYDARRYDRTTKDLVFTKAGATEYDWTPCALGLA